MVAEAPVRAEIPEVEPDPPAPRRKHRVPRAKPWWIRLHRWVALTVGVLLLLECVSGAILLMRPETDRWAHPERFHSTPSTHPLDAVDAMQLVARQFPGLKPDSAGAYKGVWKVPGNGDQTIFVDAGSGHVNAIESENSGLMGFVSQVHDCFFSCQGQPGYLSFMNDNVPIPGQDFTYAYYLLGILALALAFLAISGLVAWWPALRKWGSALRVRTKRGPYARDLDLHKLIGILAMPLLFMWGYTGMTIAGFQWPNKAFYAVVPTSASVSATPPVGKGPVISPREALAEAQAADPTGQVVAFRTYGVDDPGGTYLINISHNDGGIYRDKLDWGPTDYVTVDGHGGGAEASPNLNDIQHFYEKFFQSLHTGGNVPWVPRLLLEVTSGLAMIPLAITGITVWLTKWRSRRGRRRRRRAQPA